MQSPKMTPPQPHPAQPAAAEPAAVSLQRLQISASKHCFLVAPFIRRFIQCLTLQEMELISLLVVCWS